MSIRSILAFIPNSLTLVRIALIPAFVYVSLFSENLDWVAALLFGIAAFTDWLDGLLARKLDATSRLGQFLDPVADKLVVLSALVILIGQYGTIWLTIPGIVIVCRELVISALREWMADVGQGMVLNVSFLAKIKTAVQMVAIAILLANSPDLERPWVLVGLVLFYIATFLTIWSMLAYLWRAWHVLRPLQ